MEGEKLKLNQLPEKVLQKIGDYLYPYNGATLRSTCSEFKNLIDTYVGINVDFIENPLLQYTKKHLNFIGKTAIHELVAQNMLGKESKTGKRTYLYKNCSFDDLIGFPHLLRSCILQGKTHVQFLWDVLSKCENLQNLYLMDGFELEGDLVHFLIKEDKKKDFKINSDIRSKWLSILSQRGDIFRSIKLKKLTYFYFIFKSQPIKNSGLLNLMLLLKCIKSEELKRGQVSLPAIKDFKEMEYFHLCMIFADFLEAHVETFKDFTFLMASPNVKESYQKPTDIGSMVNSMFNDHFQREPDEMKGGDGVTVDQKLKMMNILKQRFAAIGGISKLTYFKTEIPPIFHWDFWLVFIGSLQKLITLSMYVSTKYRILKNCDFVKSSSQSLKRLRLDLDIVNNFDFSGIENCTSLEEFYLFNKPISSDLILQGPLEAHVKNVQLLPPGLQALTLGCVVAASDDLNKMLAKQKNLDSLVIMNMPSMNTENGADCKCLKKIFRMRHLHSCLIQSFRCKSQKTFNRVYQMLAFQQTSQDKSFARKMDSVLGYSPKIQSASFLDIVSTEISPRYTWYKNFFPDGLFSHYSMGHISDDPYL